MSTLKSFLKISFLLIFILSLSACSDDKEVPNYELQHIMWKLGEGDGVEYLEKKIKPLVYTNPTTESRNVIFDETDEIEETSQFYIDDPILLNTVKEKFIEVPITDTTSFLDKEYGYLVSNLKVPFDINENILPPRIVATSSFEIKPNMQVSMEGIIKLKKITAYYKAILKDIDNGSSIEIEGKWVGVFHNGSDIVYTNTPIK